MHLPNIIMSYIIPLMDRYHYSYQPTHFSHQLASWWAQVWKYIATDKRSLYRYKQVLSIGIQYCKFVCHSLDVASCPGCCLWCSRVTKRWCCVYNIMLHQSRDEPWTPSYGDTSPAAIGQSCSPFYVNVRADWIAPKRIFVLLRLKYDLPAWCGTWGPPSCNLIPTMR